MKPIVSIGNQDFRSIRENHNFYIDKTAFIKEWWENQDTVTLITRPRRFGKTLNGKLNLKKIHIYCSGKKLHPHQPFQVLAWIQLLLFLIIFFAK